ncbi:hypothetical protein V6N12_049342 [Hibiscus sabdariffa]|uniref:Reverse transcriptase domain-containing protein n=1 Tax=Hibiscus sabdariffa TaxID=183260 RepID=A0ABR2CB15_9ROSI
MGGIDHGSLVSGSVEAVVSGAGLGVELGVVSPQAVQVDGVGEVSSAQLVPGSVPPSFGQTLEDERVDLVSGQDGVFNISANKFEVLCAVVDDQVVKDVLTRPERVAAGGVAELMEKLKPKEKGRVAKKKRERVLEKRVELENVQKMLMCEPTADYVRREKDLKKTYEAISAELIDYFSGSFGVKDDNVQGVSDSLLKDILGCELAADVKDDLVALVTMKEVKDVVFGMNGNKAPGPDGYSAKFFQVAWRIVGDDFMRAVLYFFSSCSLPAAFNSTILTLVSNVEVPSYAAEFRPIACCSIVYKCITKIIANRLKPCLPSIILSNQSAFLQGRDLVENVLLAQEIVNGYGRQHLSPRCALKIDLRKAFDSLSWDFILQVLKVLGFPPLFVRWIATCITCWS